jgi:hypothetical protein
MIAILLGLIVVGTPIYVWLRAAQERRWQRKLGRAMDAKYDLVRLLYKLDINSAGEAASTLYAYRRMRSEWRMMRGIGRP